jgi:hypothetical protein
MSSKTNQLPDSIDVRAKNKAAEIPQQELQREILAQLYIQNHFQTHQFKALQSIKGHMVFYTLMMVLSFVLAIVIFSK